ncbi:phosphorylase family protein [Baekduia soli]|uniref:phosphorylase family protein n=1 Tax=Baekduia soli TaxID=496014 RepID=UPI001651B3FF|nr:purine-nucleoside phosphorylase [Baekduia soli]
MPGDPQPVHLRPTTALAPRVLLPGDPGRALALAQVVLGDDRRMFNHHRGLWGYTGTAHDGAPLTIQSTGMGGPSAAIVLEELAALGVRRAVRVGTAEALDAALAPGDLVAAAAVLAADGTSRALGGPERAELDAALTGALAGAVRHTGLVVSSDLVYAVDAAPARAWRAAGALARDLETAALAAVAARHGIAFGSVVAIVLDAAGTRLDDERATAAGEAAGEAGAAALTAAG